MQKKVGRRSLPVRVNEGAEGFEPARRVTKDTGNMGEAARFVDTHRQDSAVAFRVSGR